MLKEALKILREEFTLKAKPPSPEKRLFTALKSIEALRAPLKNIAPVTETADLRLACASGVVETWSFDQFVDIKLAHKGWISNSVTDVLHKLQAAAKNGRIGFEELAGKLKDDTSAKFIFGRTGDIEAVAKELAAMKPADMKDVPRTAFWA